MLTHVWAFFLELNQARSGSGFGANPISYTEILAWSQLTERNLSAFEVSAIKAVDRLFMGNQAKAAQKTSSS